MMKYFLTVAAALGVLAYSTRYSMAGDGNQEQDWKSAVASLRDSVRDLRAAVDSLRQQSPGLGEYMTTMQLHAAKLWFAVKESNWDLASYEAGELNETMDAAAALHVFRNKVNIAGVLESVQQTQIQSLKHSLEAKNHKHFTVAYKQTLEACNGCHTSAGYKFISIIPPTREPVANQKWSKP